MGRVTGPCQIRFEALQDRLGVGVGFVEKVFVAGEALGGRLAFGDDPGVVVFAPASGRVGALGTQRGW